MEMSGSIKCTVAAWRRMPVQAGCDHVVLAIVKLLQRTGVRCELTVERLGRGEEGEATTEEIHRLVTHSNAAVRRVWAHEPPGGKDKMVEGTRVWRSAELARQGRKQELVKTVGTGASNGRNTQPIAPKADNRRPMEKWLTPAASSAGR